VSWADLVSLLSVLDCSSLAGVSEEEEGATEERREGEGEEEVGEEIESAVSEGEKEEDDNGGVS